jgi:hypothetical protein
VRIALRHRCRSTGGVGGRSNHRQELTRSRGSLRKPTSEPPEGGSGVVRGRSRGCSERLADPHRGGGAGGFVEISRSSRLQGFAPLTNPLRHVAVASDLALVSSMGFVFPSKVTCAPHHPGDARTGESSSVEPKLDLGGPLPESPRQAVAAGADGIPSVVHSLTRCRSRRGETAAKGDVAEAESESRRHAFSAGRGNPLPCPDRASGRSRRWRVWAVPPESVRSARS